MLAIKPYNTFMLHRYRLKVKLEAQLKFHKYMSSYGYRPGPAGRHEY